MAFGDIVQETDRYFLSASGVLVPKAALKESSSRAWEVSPHVDPITSLEMYIRAQVFQSRRPYFVYGMIYETDPWVRACIDYIVRQWTRDPNRLVDHADPLNPDIEDLSDFLEDQDFSALYAGWAYDLLKYQQSVAYIEWTLDRDPKKAKIWPLDSRITFPITDQHGTVILFAQVYNGHVEYFMPDEVLYFTTHNNNSHPSGLPSMRTLIDTIALNSDATSFNIGILNNGMSVGNVFAMKNATPEEVKLNDRILRDKLAGPRNAGRHIILTGDTQLLRDGNLAIKDMNFGELIQHCRHAACGVFGVPESLLGISHNVNRSEGKNHIKETYNNTVRPWRTMLNRQFTRQFIRKIWGSKDICLEEPIGSRLPTVDEIDSVLKVAQIGIKYNDLLEMLGLERVPNGDYFVSINPGNGQMVRLDHTMPGLGDPHFNFPAYERQYQQQQAQATEFAMQGMQAPAPAVPYTPPRSQDQTQLDPIGARIIDVSRAMDAPTLSVIWCDPEGADEFTVLQNGAWMVERRNPMAPGTRGGRPYTTRTGKIRYGVQPANKPAPSAAPADATRNNDITNPRDPNAPKQLSPEERTALDSARNQVNTTLRSAQTDNWTNDQFLGALQNQGWDIPSGADRFTDVRDARDAADLLSSQYPDNAYVVLGSDGQYFVMYQPLDNFTGNAGSTPTLKNYQGTSSGAGAVDAGSTGGAGAKLARSFISPALSPEEIIGNPLSYVERLRALVDSL